VAPRPLRVTTLALSLVAVGITAYLTYTHYTDPGGLACPDTGVINCTLVTTSPWSVLLGVPVALLGLLWAAAMTVVNLPRLWRSPSRVVDTLRLGLAGAGAGMVLYLVYVELFRVNAICLWCTGVHITAVLLFGMILAARSPRLQQQLLRPVPGRSAPPGVLPDASSARPPGSWARASTSRRPPT
jgi:uncharacterized membrane protein